MSETVTHGRLQNLNKCAPFREEKVENHPVDCPKLT